MLDGGARSHSRILRIVVEFVEVSQEMLELLLAIIIIITVLLNIMHLFKNIFDIEFYTNPTKEDVLKVLDLTLLLVLAVDILRTLAVAIRRGSLPVRIVIEAAMIAILREVIAVEIRHLDYKMVLSLGITFILLAGAWAAIGVLQRRGLIGHTAVEEEG